MDFKTAVEGIKQNSCPQCNEHGSLHFDVQADSIYCSCEKCGEFEISAFRDKFNGSLILYYLNNADTGDVAGNNLQKLQNVLFRNKFIKKRIFTLKVQNRIF
ncbi:MAG: hypothetical protein ACTSWY_14340 [Promethearchaeota archaeon]